MRRLTGHQLKYRKSIIVIKVLKHTVDKKSQTDFYILEKLVEDRLIEFFTTAIGIYHQISYQSQSKFLQQHNNSETLQLQGISYVIAVAREANLSIDNQGDISMLSNATNCCHSFSTSVLTAIANNENNLLKRNLRCDSIKATHWLNDMINFVLQIILGISMDRQVYWSDMEFDVLNLFCSIQKKILQFSLKVHFRNANLALQQ